MQSDESIKQMTNRLQCTYDQWCTIKRTKTYEHNGNKNSENEDRVLRRLY